MFIREMDLNWSLPCVADFAGRTVAFAVVWVMDQTAQLQEFAVSPDFRGKGLGQGFLLYLFQRVKERGSKKMQLEYREGNEPAFHLYQKMGFKEVGIRKNIYDQEVNRSSNAVLMECDLS